MRHNDASLAKDSRVVLRQDIIDTASKLFGSRGYVDTDVQDVADTVGVGKATVYRQFETKENLFMACLEHGLDKLNEFMLDRAETRPEDLNVLRRVEAGVLDFLEFFDKNSEIVEILILARSLFREKAVNAYRRYWEYNSSTWMGRLQTLIDQGKIRSAHPEQIIDVFNNVLYGALFTRYFGFPKAHPKVVAKSIADCFVNGLASESERELIAMQAGGN